ncbi:hypothetical protein ONE63_010385 [Megalurothrips usitatus]|uniref:Cilia- and flagella-associated protein 57 n=1 Tax=Megalurothrips usitatus TaxID=439358 RepID=A0AAV7XCS7_9NEOP|nr:hypothetical protein ONE63_010385 [Megalurothrips usitatus]
MSAGDAALSLPGLQPVAFFGLRVGVKGNAYFLTDHDILYPAGSVLVVHNHIQKHQKFIKLVDQQQHEQHAKDQHTKELHSKEQQSKEQHAKELHKIKEIVLSPSRKIAAITEHGEKPLITIYDLESLKRKRVLTLPGESDAREFVTFAFTNDGKGILAVTGEPDWSLYSFNWEKGKMESSCKATVIGNSGTVAQIATHPTDHTTCVLVGPGLFRLLMVTETVWRQFGWQKADALPLSCVAYLTPERILAGTKDGRLVLVENNDLKGVFKAADIKELDPKTLEVQQSSTSLTAGEAQVDADMEVRGLISFYKGFAFSLGTGLIHLFEVDPNQVYRKRNIFSIPTSSEFDSMYKTNLNSVRHLCINISQDRLIATTDRCQLYTTKLWGTDISQNSKIPMKLLGQQLHHGPVSGLAVCAWKPIFMTVGESDRTVRLWNYETETQDLIKQYVEDIFCIALHPTGLYAILGFCDKLRYMTVLIDDLQELRVFPIRNCNTCSYSNNGHMFAAANENIIQLFSTITFENMYNFKGHFGEIKRMIWTPDDLKLISCGLEGAVYEWEVATGSRISEVITKSCGYSDICVTTDGKSIYSVGSDGYIKEMTGSQIVREVVVGDVKKMDSVKLDAVVLSRSNLMLFTAGLHGVIYSVKYPLTDPAIYGEYHVHYGDVTHMRLTYDDKVLLSIAKDGSVCIWNLTNTEGKTVEMDKDFSHSQEILISRNELEEKILTIKDQQVRLNELETEHSYNTRKMESEYQDKMKELNDSYRAVVEELKAKNENLEADHVLEMNKTQTDISEMKSAHEQAMQTLETNYYGKLIVEYDKYTALDTRFSNMRDDYERQLKALQSSKDKDLAEQAEQYKDLLRKKESEYEQLQKQLEQERIEHEEIKHQIEDDADREIVGLRAQYESQLRGERDNNVRLRGEAGIMKKKLIGSQKEVDELKHQVFQLQGEQQQYQQAVHGLDRDVLDLKKEVVERDTTIQLKEKNIFDLKKANQELDKFKFVLNYKIKELKSEIEPKDLEIKEKKEQIQDMEQELERLQRNSESLKVEMNEIKEKLSGTEAELQMEKSGHVNSKRLLKRLWVDLHNTSSLIQSPHALCDSMKLLYQKYSGNPSLLLSRAQDTDAQAEFKRQREHLERTVASLKRQVYKGSLSKQGDYARIMEENIYLIEELNSVRNTLKKSQNALQNLEMLLGISTTGSSRVGNASDLQERLQKALQLQEERRERGSDRTMELEKKVLILQEEIDRLITKLEQSEKEAYLQEKKMRESKHIQFSRKKGAETEEASFAD